MERLYSICISSIAALLLIVVVCSPSKSDLERARTEGNKEGYEQGYDDGYAAGYEEGYDEGHKQGYNEGYNELKPVTMPKSGEVLSGSETKWQSELTVKASYGTSCVVSVKNSYGKECVTFFVRSGDTVTMGVPNEKLRVYFASGSKWYGYGRGKMFGKETSYTKDDDLLDFSKYTWSYTLYPVTNGNFSETPSSASEFF